MRVVVAGAILLGWTALRRERVRPTRDDPWALVALIAAPLWWAVGSVWYARRGTKLSIRAVSGWQHLFGGASFLLMILIMREPLPTPTPEAWGTWIYLTLFGSVLAFTSYVTILKKLPVQVVMTYAYANPVIAVLLGWLVLSERLDWWVAGGSLLVLAGIAGVFNNKPAKDD